MLTKDEVATLESLIRRMSSVQRDALEHWLESFYDFGEADSHDGHPLVPPAAGRLDNDRPLQEEIDEEVEWVEWSNQSALHEAQANPDSTVG